MKNFFIRPLMVLCIITISMISCIDDNDRVTITKDEYNRLKDDTQLRTIYPKPFKLFDDDLNRGDNGIVLGSDNHEYLIINHYSTSICVLHYIDCELCKNKEKLLQESLYVKDTLTTVH